MRSSGPRTPRRQVLTGAVAACGLLLAGCKGIGALGTPPKPAPDVAVLTDAMNSEKLLLARYQAVFDRFPALAGPLAPLPAQHRAHLARLRSRLADARPAASPSHPAAPSAPATTPAALAYLRASEQSAATALLGHLNGVPPSLAQLLASISASEATHAAALAAREGSAA